MEAFIINNQFVINTSKNLVNDTKLEPRLIKLLCLLIKNSGKVVGREVIITEIWQGYGGGEDGLSQAISFLRKALNDSEKTIIETVPKTGYIFNGEVQSIDGGLENQNAIKESINNKKRVILGISIFGFIAILSFILLKFQKSDSVAPKAMPKNDVNDSRSSEIAPVAR